MLEIAARRLECNLIQFRDDCETSTIRGVFIRKSHELRTNAHMRIIGQRLKQCYNKHVQLGGWQNIWSNNN